MRTAIKTINTYLYDELNDEARASVTETIKQRIIDDNFYSLDEELKTIAENEYNLIGIKLYYSFSYCQSDGLMFECDNLLRSDYIYKRLFEQLSEGEAKRAAELIADGRIKFYSYNSKNIYYYAHKYDVDYDVFELENQSDYDLAEKLQIIIADIYLNICGVMEEIGYNCYNVSEEEIRDYIDELGYEFPETGEIYTEV